MHPAGGEETAARPGVAGASSSVGPDRHRYIPYTGGNIGWLDNAGVMHTEKRSNYQLSAALDVERVRAAVFERAGVKTNKRRAPRKELNPAMKITLKVGKTSKPALCTDLSITGLRAQIVEEEVAIKTDDRVQVMIHDKTGRTLLLDVMGGVMWVEKAGKIRTLWNFGITFPPLSDKQMEAVQALIGLEQERQAG